MTAEICLMNRTAAVLAADSAITTSQSFGGVSRERYYKGANKIFQLSDHHPVAIMIHGSANFHGVPWEIIIKDYRMDLGNDAFADLDGYANRFMSFLTSHPLLSSARFLADATESTLVAALELILGAADKHEGTQRAATGADKAAAFDAFVIGVIAAHDADPPPPYLSEQDCVDAVTAHLPEAHERATNMIEFWGLGYDPNTELVAKAALRIIAKRPRLLQPETGLVFAGFGDVDRFPSFRRYEVSGLVLGRLGQRLNESGAVTHRNPAWIQPFAMSSMMETFAFGMADAMQRSLGDEARRALRSFAVEMRGGPLSVDDENLINKAGRDFDKRVFENAWKDNAQPLREVIGSLSVSELADLGETLIGLESIKERMTRPSESVSGPVDVAAVTRHEGFVWIKRKHYFDAALNPRFFQRRGASGAQGRRREP